MIKIALKTKREQFSAARRFAIVAATMKTLLVGVVVVAFVFLPLFLLQTLVMPEMKQLQRSYAQAGQAAQTLFPQQ